DEAAADDLVQEAWLAALTRPPREGRLRPWLREVARNFARQHHRGKARRAAREAVARAPAGPEAPPEVAERLGAEPPLPRRARGAGGAVPLDAHAALLRGARAGRDRGAARRSRRHGALAPDARPRAAARAPRSSPRRRPPRVEPRTRSAGAPRRRGWRVRR